MEMEIDISVAIVTCSESDFAAMADAVDLFEHFEVGYEMVAISHQAIAEYAEKVRGRGIKFILAGTGNAPYLPSMLAEYSSLPVVGVPLPASILGGEKPPSSLVFMTDNVPLATVAPGDARNAALLALRTFALDNHALQLKLDKFGSS